MLGAWWLMQGGEPPAGTPLGRDEALVLWSRLDALAERMRAPRVARVVLTHEPGAAAVAHQDPWLPWRHHHTLALGLPLLAHMPPDEMEAVIAHELGHFSRHFGPAGHRLYRARLGWAQLREASDDDIVWYRAAAGFARWFCRAGRAQRIRGRCLVGRGDLGRGARPRPGASGGRAGLRRAALRRRSVAG